MSLFRSQTCLIRRASAFPRRPQTRRAETRRFAFPCSSAECRQTACHGPWRNADQVMQDIWADRVSREPWNRPYRGLSLGTSRPSQAFIQPRPAELQGAAGFCRSAHSPRPLTSLYGVYTYLGIYGANMPIFTIRESGFIHT